MIKVDPSIPDYHLLRHLALKNELFNYLLKGIEEGRFMPFSSTRSDVYPYWEQEIDIFEEDPIYRAEMVPTDELPDEYGSAFTHLQGYLENYIFLSRLAYTNELNSKNIHYISAVFLPFGIQHYPFEVMYSTKDEGDNITRYSSKRGALHKYGELLFNHLESPERKKEALRKYI